MSGRPYASRGLLEAEVWVRFLHHLFGAAVEVLFVFGEVGRKGWVRFPEEFSGTAIELFIRDVAAWRRGIDGRHEGGVFVGSLLLQDLGHQGPDVGQSPEFVVAGGFVFWQHLLAVDTLGLDGAKLGDRGPLLLERLTADGYEGAKGWLLLRVEERVDLGGAGGKLGFDAVAGEEAPHGGDDLMKEYSFGGACGGEVDVEGGDEVVELGLVGRVNDDVLTG